MGMAKMIFSNRSYLMAYGPGSQGGIPAELAKTLDEVSTREGFKFVGETDVAEFNTVLEKVKRRIGILLFGKVEPAVLEQAKKQGCPVLEFPAGATVEHVLVALNKELDKLVPARVEEFVRFCLGHTFNAIFRNLNLTWDRKLINVDQSQYDYMVMCDTLAGDISGKLVIWTNEPKLKAVSAKTGVSLIGDASGELANQFVGLVNYNLMKMGLQPKLSLPTLFDAKKLQGVKSMIYTPMIRLHSTDGSAVIEFGFTNIEGGPNVDLGKLKFERPSEEVQFL